MYEKIIQDCEQYNALLVAVSKTKTTADILAIYDKGQRDFGENRAQEMAEKFKNLPKDIRWHFIGNLQSKKVKYIAPFVHLIHSVDRISLLEAIEKEAAKYHRTIDILIQPKIAKEESKSGASEEETNEMISLIDKGAFPHINLRGLMGMATFTHDQDIIQKEFKSLKEKFDDLTFQLNKPQFNILSMGMSGDYKLALINGSTMIRVGSLIFGERNYN